MLKKLYRFLAPKWQVLYMEYKVQFKPRYGHGKQPHKGLYDYINSQRLNFKEIIDVALSHRAYFATIPKHQLPSDQITPYYINGFLPGLDIVAMYAIISHFKPAQYIEVGSGNSTKVAYSAIQNNGLATQIISIDPQPRAEIDQLANQVIRKPFEDTDFSLVFSMKPNDVLFIDNSHRMLPNSDSTVFFLEVLPLLPSGVIVHIHDIYLPYDYPQFMCDRFYSEQYGLAIFLLANPSKYKLLMANYFISEDPELSQQLDPIFSQEQLKGVERHGGSFWFQVE
jgi:hypothetical protein